jgi:hypothetical protein
MSIFRRREPFPTTVRCTMLFLFDFIGGVNTTYTLSRKPLRQLRSGMSLLIVSLYARGKQITARLGRITAAHPGIIEFELHVEAHVYPLRVPADWVRLSFWEAIRFGHRIRTPESFVTPVNDNWSEADVPIAPVSHVISRLRPSISMFELNVHAPQED